jgi:hypothetical protein
MLHLSSLERRVDAYELDVWKIFLALIGTLLLRLERD